MNKLARSSGLSCAILLALTPHLSCRSALHGEGEGRIVIALPGLEGAARDGARGLLDSWPMDGLPVFSSLTVTVSGPGMAPVTRQLSSYGGPIELAVPPGSSRSVNVRAVPDWADTATAYPGKPIPTLAKAYAGSATVDVAPNEAAPVAIALSLAETKILVPNMHGDVRLAIADSLTSSTLASIEGFTIEQSSRFRFDQKGQLYRSSGTTVEVYGDLSSGAIASLSLGQNVDSFAIDSRAKRLYGYKETSPRSLVFLNLEEAAASPVEVSLLDGINLMQGGIAVDDLGYLYLIVNQDDINGLAMLSVSMNGEIATATVVAFRSLQELGLGYHADDGDGGLIFRDVVSTPNLLIDDTVFFDGAIVFLIRETNSSPSNMAAEAISRGKAMAVNVPQMTVRFAIGWRNEDERRPEEPFNSSFHGPRRFVALAAKRLFIADDGFYYSDAGFNSSGLWNPFIDVDRIITIGTAVGSSTTFEVGLADVSYLYSQYDSIQVYGTC